MTPVFHLIKVDLTEDGLPAWVTAGIARLEAYLARYAEFVRLYGA